MTFVYPHPEWFEQEKAPEINKGDRILLWGAGRLGVAVAYSVEQCGYEIDAFVDAAEEKWETVYYGHKVISPQTAREHYRDAVVIVSNAFPDTIDCAAANGHRRVFDAHSFLMKIDFSNYRGEYPVEQLERCIVNGLGNYAMYYGENKRLERLYFIITERCSLRCRNCDGYIPYYDGPCDEPVERIIDSFERLMKVCRHIYEINVYGGEPFIHKRIYDIAGHFVNDDRVERVVFITNGTILPDARLVRVLKNRKCHIRISDYGMLSRKKHELVQMLEAEGIAYEVTKYEAWDRVPLIQKTDETEAELDRKFATCISNQLYVKDGKIYYCNFLAGICSLGEAIPRSERDYVNLFENVDFETLREHVEAYIAGLHTGKHIHSCKFCPGSHCLQFEEKLPVAEQTKEILTAEALYLGGKRLWN